MSDFFKDNFKFVCLEENDKQLVVLGFNHQKLSDIYLLNFEYNCFQGGKLIYIKQRPQYVKIDWNLSLENYKKFVFDSIGPNNKGNILEILSHKYQVKEIFLDTVISCLRDCESVNYMIHY